MPVDVVDLKGFYAAPLGVVARRLVGRAIDSLWGDMPRQRLLGIGYATPYLAPFRPRMERTLAFMPAMQGVVNWPPNGVSSSALVDPTMQPLLDASIDRIIIVHALEISDAPEDLLSEVWRILTPGGRMIVVVPNRRGLWARMDTTPFGQGLPYSRSQLTGLLRRSLFSPENWGEALYVPPLRGRLFLRAAVAWERAGARLSLPFAGVHVMEATKQLHRPVTVRKVRRSRSLSPVLLPTPGPPVPTGRVPSAGRTPDVPT
jgi:SAM-dependent methyltransferase